MRWNNLLTILSLVAVAAWVFTAPLTAQGHLPQPEPQSVALTDGLTEPTVTVSAKAGSSFDDTEFLVRIQSPQDLPLISEVSGQMPALTFEVSGDSFQKSFVHPARSSKSWKLPANQVGEWTVFGSELRARTASGELAEDARSREVPAGPLQVKVTLLTIDPNSNEFSRGARFLHLESETVTLLAR